VGISIVSPVIPEGFNFPDSGAAAPVACALLYRKELLIRQAEAAATAQKRREDEAREQRRLKTEAEATKERLLKVNARAAADARERARALQLEREGVQRRLDAAALATRRAALIGRLNACFESDFLSADTVFAADPARDVVSTEEHRRMKTDFVRAWAARELRDQLDDDQAASVATVGGDVKVIARAGSGKTRTLTTRAIFLQKHCGISPRELLLLAFNKRAAAEMKTRLRQALGDDLPHGMTFHALAHALVHPDEDLVFDDQGAGQLGLSREIQEVIDDHIRSPEFSDRVRELMLAHFRDDWERIVDGRIELTIDEFLAYRRALPRETLRGDFVKSFGEREIANALFENAVPYAYVERIGQVAAGRGLPGGLPSCREPPQADGRRTVKEDRRRRPDVPERENGRAPARRACEVRPLRLRVDGDRMERRGWDRSVIGALADDLLPGLKQALDLGRDGCRHVGSSGLRVRVVIYDDAQAEVRRRHRDGSWHLAGVVVRGTWAPAAAGITSAPIRMIEAGLVELRPLPTFTAPDHEAALTVALRLARARWNVWSGGPRWHEIGFGIR
jgi:UvrD/REP helicase N-terminal domain